MITLPRSYRLSVRIKISELGHNSKQEQAREPNPSWQKKKKKKKKVCDVNCNV
jgi:hypothetical protein